MMVGELESNNSRRLSGNSAAIRLKAYRLANLFLLVAFAIAVAVLLAGRVTRRSRVALPIVGEITTETCIFKRTHGVECSSCGLTRSVVSVFDGDLQTARNFHPAGWKIAVFLVFQLALRALFSFRSFARFWKWDVAVTVCLIAICFFDFIVQVPNPIGS